jgi:hypothetical protein
MIRSSEVGSCQIVFPRGLDRFVARDVVSTDPDPGAKVASTPQLISELIRAANQVDKLSAFEMARLLDRAISEVNDLRHRAGIIHIPGRDAALYVRKVAADAERVPRGDWDDGLLYAAEMVRDLHIVVAGGTNITFAGSGAAQ